MMGPEPCEETPMMHMIRRGMVQGTVVDDYGEKGDKFKSPLNRSTPTTEDGEYVYYICPDGSLQKIGKIMEPKASRVVTQVVGGEEQVRVQPSINTLIASIGTELDRAEKHLAALHDALEPFLRPWEVTEKELASPRESSSHVAEQLEIILARTSALANRCVLIREHIDWQL